MSSSASARIKRSVESPPPAQTSVLPHAGALAELRETAAQFYAHGWAFGTSGNYSVVVGREPLRMLITASGRDKRRLGDDDFVVVDAAARPTADDAPRPSAETALHTMLAQDPRVGAVLHTHSVWNTLLSERHAEQRALTIGGYEMLKGLAGVTTHETEVRVPIFDNNQDIAVLAAEVSARLRPCGNVVAAAAHAFLLRGHGLYTWGADLAEARRHVEILEFLFEVMGRRLSMTHD